MVSGLAWALVAVVIWAGWFTATAHGVRGELSVIDVALVRVAVPALVLSPWLWRARARLVALAWWQVAGIALYGVPFVVLLATGLRFAPVSHAAALVPGLMPVVAGALGAWLLRERVGARRRAGFAAMLLAAALVAADAGVFGAGLADGLTGAARGHPFFLAAMLAFVGFTFAARRAGLEPLVTTGLVGLVSTVLLVPPYLLFGLGGLAAAPVAELAFQVVAQGLLAGVVAVFAFATAIRRLGAAPAAAGAALVPGSATLIAWAVLGERPSALAGVAMVVVGIGVWLASGLRLRGSRESRRRRSDRPAA